MPTTTGLATSFITFSRPGASGGGATVTDRDGRIKWAGHNLLLASESFDSSSWTKASSTVSANAIAAPNGTTTADSILEVAASAVHGIYNNTTVSLTVGAKHVLAVFVKTNGRDFITLNCSSSSNNWVSATLSFASLSVTKNEAGSGGGTYIGGSVIPLSNSWYLCSIEFIPSTASGNYLNILSCTSGTPTYDSTYGYPAVFTGDAAKGYYLWGAHLYRSDLGGMQQNPAMPAGMQSYYPTTPRNLLGYTEDANSWTKSNVTVSTNAAVAPNGLQTADLMYPSTTGTARQAIQSAAGVANTPYTTAHYVKSAGFQWIALTSPQGNSYGVYFDVINGVKGAEASGCVGSITPVGNGWYHCSITQTVSGTTIYSGVALTDANNSTTATANGTSGIYLWGAQLSDSASLDTYVPQYGAAVTSAAYYAPRLDFDPVTLAARGLLVEEARTNLIRYSRTLETTSSYWANLASGTANTITVDNAAGPDGAATSASLLTFNTAVPPGVGTDYSVWRHMLTTTANGTYTFSVWMKAGTTSSVYLFFNDSGGNRAATQCTLTSNWQRFTVTGTTVASITGITVDIGGSGFYSSPVAAGTIYIYGAQLEAGAFSTSYIPNGATVAGATRAADVASVSTQAFPYSASEGTLVISAQLFPNGGSGSLAGFNDGTSSNGIALSASPSNGFTGMAIRAAGATQADMYEGSTASAGLIKIGGVWKVNDAAYATGGTIRGTPDPSLTVPSVTQLRFPYLLTAAGAEIVGSSWIRQITYLPRRISNAELQSRTA